MDGEAANLDRWNILVGEIAAPFGVQGEVKVLPATQNERRFDPHSRLCLASPEGLRRIVVVESSRRDRRAVVLRLEGIRDRAEAEALRGADLFVSEEMLPPLPEGRFYIKDILGMEVCSTEGEPLGIVDEVLETGGNDVFVTHRGLIPATKEVVRSIDFESRQMVVNLLPGLLDG
ncbi:MAG: 16S rRNA processing protein RimM [Armatimonadetes bacterium CG2_30_59_28]|nr:16S rRNA processing protein RimM [Armatimonadota bacterium]OIO92286.1 MAG: 16S rRNA processing protein RimM [Armatimonadetes bacterium CG2_30_59_28]PIU65310.1 MAG: 16S rRNA processing protein RimM [Armatimonadetes bacterium CG07_land_8_20_14_0_80_59_28]PIX42694.1 MAG: 16S rRNA processing protein RimM [Armatimonadetes bacterium CG_4_8_14_3_um_filter_58_9]PIY40664.1 MAG: 16S rRNA processing protein RimM [Armatimonadetes bacterium CG_4_10_14_3_um_filter_59_10]PJB78160.1 MAG: 16S rRNA processin